MEIINPRITKDLDNKVALRLNLGCGLYKEEGYYGLDNNRTVNADIVADLNEPLSLLPDNSVAEVVSRHVLEHVQNFMGLMSELHRIVRSDGKLTLIVPHFSLPLGYSDPTHVRYFGLYTMCYFAALDKQPFERKVQAYYSEIRFTILDVTIKFTPPGGNRWLGKLKEILINCNTRFQETYERSLTWLVPAYEIHYILTPDK